MNYAFKGLMDMTSPRGGGDSDAPPMHQGFDLQRVMDLQSLIHDTQSFYGYKIAPIVTSNAFTLYLDSIDECDKSRVKSELVDTITSQSVLYECNYLMHDGAALLYATDG